MIDKKKLAQALVVVERQYGSVLLAPNSAMQPIWQLTKRHGEVIYVSQSVYDTIENYVSSQKTVHPQREYLVAKELQHDPAWLRYRVQAYQEERLEPILERVWIL
ncbi:hypothetical protein [Lactiplantibacillus herbarum]|uniref:hypothetical protein n=1 Tax=Lactiplantibacillus herbarum TaxID=1670446 RepID=UPI00064FC726|nr:hypothetical protein [Lactiplantibacillus herbarum]